MSRAEIKREYERLVHKLVPRMMSKGKRAGRKRLAKLMNQTHEFKRACVTALTISGERAVRDMLIAQLPAHLRPPPMIWPSANGLNLAPDAQHQLEVRLLGKDPAMFFKHFVLPKAQPPMRG